MKLLAALAVVTLGLSAVSQDGPLGLINGQEIDKKVWNAVVYISAGSGRCTASVVGPRTVQSAAHCMGNGASISFQTASGDRYTAKCTHAPEYSQAAYDKLQASLTKGMKFEEVQQLMSEQEFVNATADYALCQTDKVVTGVTYDKVSSQALVKVGDEVVHVGYGCVRPGGGGGNDGILRMGTAKVTSTPNGNDNDIVTVGGAALCFGDSGGPAYFVPIGKTIEDRINIAINSRGDIRRTSYVSSNSTPTAQRFYRSWRTRTGEKICGLDSGVPDCRGANPAPVPREFVFQSRKINLKVKVKPENQVSDQDIRNVFQIHLNALDRE